MRTYKLYWSSDIELIDGDDIYDALDRIGYGQCALQFVEHWEEMEE